MHQFLRSGKPLHIRIWRVRTDRECWTGLRLFFVAYISLFAVAGVVLFSHRTTPFGPTFFSSENAGWPTLESFLFKSDSRWNALHDVAKMDCSSLEDMCEVRPVAHGWTKAVYSAVLRGQPLAIKTVNMRGRDLLKCQGIHYYIPTPQWQRPSAAECYRRAASKIMKEVAILTQLAPHDNFIQVLGTCVRDASGPVIMMVELGEPLDTVKLLRLEWIERLKLAKGIAEILYRLAHSHLGSLAMNDMRRQQFVLVDNTLKLSDVDDIGMSEPTCEQEEHCAIRSDNDTVVEQLSCVNNTCMGYNERLNIYRAGQHFITQFLPIGVPPFLEQQTQLLLDAYERRAASALWDTQRILTATDNLLHLYQAQQNVLGKKKNYGNNYTSSYTNSRPHAVTHVLCILKALSMCALSENRREKVSFCSRHTRVVFVCRNYDHS